MKTYLRNYLRHFGLAEGMHWRCEYCGQEVVIPNNAQVHHIEPRGMGGSKLRDCTTNLICLCLDCHRRAEAKEITKQELKMIVIDRELNYTKKKVLAR